jgi:hemerythrin-like domain-containing protein
MAHEFLETLEKEHVEVQEILEKLKNTSGKAVKSKEDLFMKLKQELIPHMKGEEKHFYPLLLKKKEGKEIGLEALEEHHVAEMILKELDSLSKSDETWNAKISVFAEIVKHHIEEEEEEVFEKAKDLLTDDELNKIMSSFTSEKEKVKKGIK